MGYCRHLISCLRKPKYTIRFYTDATRQQDALYHNQNTYSFRYFIQLSNCFINCPEEYYVEITRLCDNKIICEGYFDTKLLNQFYDELERAVSSNLASNLDEN